MLTVIINVVGQKNNINKKITGHEFILI